MLLFMVLQVLSDEIPNKVVKEINDPNEILREALAIKLEIFQ